MNKESLKSSDIITIRQNVEKILRKRILKQLNDKGVENISKSFSDVIDYNFQYKLEKPKINIYFNGSDQKYINGRIQNDFMIDSDNEIFEIVKLEKNRMKLIVFQDGYFDDFNFRFWTKNVKYKKNTKKVLNVLIETKSSLDLNDLEKEMEKNINKEILKAAILFYFKGLTIDEETLSGLVTVFEKECSLNFNMETFNWKYSIMNIITSLFLSGGETLKNYVVIKDDKILSETLELININYKI